MAVFSPDQNYSQQAAQAPISFGNPALNQYVQYYQDLVAANGGQPSWGAGNDLSGINRGGQMLGQAEYAPNIDGTTERGWGTNRGVQDMSTPDRFFASLAKFGDTIAGAGGFEGWDENKSAGENIGSFITSLPTGMASAPFSGAASLYEGITGKPVTQSDLESNQMAGEDLTGFQRAGAIGTGLVDTLGLFLGGSAEALNAARNVTRVARGKEAAAPIGAAASKFMGRGAGAIAVDTLEEGAEEAFQSVMEDVRHERLDDGSVGRALEGFVYGAAGGAVMSAGGQAINSALGSGSATTSAATSAPTQSGISEYHKNVGRQSDPNMIAGRVIDYALEREGRLHEVPGSAMTLNVVKSDKSLEHADVGYAYFEGAYGSTEEGSREAVADMLHTTTEVLDNIILTDKSLAQKQAEIQELIDATNGEAYIVIERTPKTSGLTSALKLKLDTVIDGNGLSVHPQVMKIMGGDQDGDMSFTYSGTRKAPDAISPANSHAYLSSGTGLSLFDKDYFTFNFTDDGVNKAWLDLINTDPSLKKGPIYKAFNNVMNAAKEMSRGNADVNAFSNELAKLETAFYNYRLEQAKTFIKDSNPDLTDDEINKQANRFARSFATQKISEIINTVESNARENLSGFVKRVVDDELTEANAKIAEVADSLFSKGNIKKGASTADVVTSLGDVFYSFLYGGHPVFRQNGVFYYHALNTSDKAAALGNILTDKSVFEVFVKSAYSLSEYGVKVENAIANYISAIAINNVMSGGFEVVDVNNDEQVQAFLENVRDAINHANEIFNELIESSAKDTTDPAIQEFKKQFPNASKRQPVSIEQPVSMANEMLKMFSGVKLEELIFMNEDNPLYGFTIDGAMDYLTNSAYDNPYFANTKFGTFWRSMLAAYKSRENAVGTVLESGLDSIFNDIESARKLGSFSFVPSDDTSIDKLPPDVYNLMVGLCDSIVEIIGPSAALSLRIADPVGLFNSTWGREMLLGNRDRFFKALISLNFTAKHVTDPTIKTHAYNLYDAMECYENGITDDYVSAHVENALRAHANDSLLDMHFYTIWKEHGFEVFDVIRRFTALGEGTMSLNDMVYELGALAGHDATLGDLLICAFKDSNSKMELSEISNRLIRARRISSIAIQDSGKFAKNQRKIIKSKRTSGEWSDSEIVAALRSGYHKGAVQTSRAVLTSAINSGYNIFKELVEKGTSAETGSLMQEEVSKALTGAMFNSLQAVNYGVGRIHLGDFLANREEILKLIFEKDSEIEITYEDSNGIPHSGKLTHAQLFRKVNPDFSESSIATDQDILNIFDRYPQLYTLVVPQRATPIYSGGEASSAYGMAVTPTKFIESHRKADSEDIHRGILEDSLLADLQSDEKFYKMIVAMKPEIEDLPLAAQNEIIEQATNELLEKFVRLTAMSDNEFNDFLNKNYPNTVSDTVITTLDEATRIAADFAQQLAVSSGLKAANNEVLEKTSRAALYASLSKFLFDSGKFNLVKPSGRSKKKLSKMVSMGHLQDMVDIYKVLLSMSQSQVGTSIMAMQISSVFATNIGSMIDNLDGPKSEKDAAKEALGIKDGIIVDHDKFAAALFEGLASSSDINNLVIKANDVFNTADELIKRCSDIAKKYSGELDNNGELSEKDIKKIREAFDGSEHDLAIIHQKYNGIILAALLKKTTQGTGERTNQYSISQSLELLDWFRQKAIDFRNPESGYRNSSLDVSALAPSLEQIIEPPRIDISKSSTGFAVTNIGQIMATSPIQTSVALEAANLDKIVGYGWLNSPNSKCDHLGRKVLVNEIDVSEDSKDFLELSYSLTPGGQTDTFTEGTLRYLQKNNIEEIYVYEAHHCSLLGCSKCTPYRRTLGGTIDALINGTTEDANLRMKKTLEKVRDIVLSPSDFDINQKRDAKDFNEILDAVSKVRHEFSIALNTQITSITGDIGFNNHNWHILATAMSPYVNIVTTTGRVVAVSINDVQKAANGEKTRVLSDLENEGITDVEVKLIGLDEVSSKIVHSVETYIQNCFEKGEDYSDEKAREVATNAALSWIDYEQELDVDEIFERIHYVSSAGRDAAYADHITNPVVDLLSRSQYGTGRKNFFANSTIDWSESAKRNMESADDYAVYLAVNESLKSLGTAGKYAIGSITFGNISSKEEESLRNAFKDQGFSPLLDNKGLGSFGWQGKQRRYDNILEVHIGSKEDISTTLDAYYSAVMREHYFAIPLENREIFEANIVDPYMAKNSFSVTINSRKYQLYDTRKANFIDRNYQTGYQISFSPFQKGKHPKDAFFLAVLDNYNIATGDSSMVYSKSAAARMDMTHHGYSQIKISDMIPSHINRDSSIQMMSLSDIQNLTIEDFEPAIQYYVNELKWLNEDMVRAHIENYLNRINNTITMDNFVADAQQNDCIGIVCKGDYYLPIFYTATNSPKKANVAYWLTTDGRLEMCCDGSWNPARENDKVSPYGISFKSIAAEANDEQVDRWVSVDSAGLPVYQDGEVDVLVNGPSFAGRVFGFNHIVVASNLYTLSVADGGNIFFDFVVKNGEKVPKKKDGLLLTDDEIQALVQGEYRAWKAIIDGKRIFKDQRLDTDVRNIASDILRNSGNSNTRNGAVAITNFFCPGHVEMDNGKFKYFGIIPGYGNYVDLILSKYDKEQILGIYHKMNERYCPAEIGGDATGCFFDDAGRVLTLHNKTGEGKRVLAVYAPNTFMEIGGSFGSLSSGARYSGQAMSKQLLTRTWLPDNRSYNQAQYTQLKLNRAQIMLNNKDTLKEKAEKFESKRLPALDEDLQKRVKLNSSDSILLRAKVAYRNSCIDSLDQLNRPVKIVDKMGGDSILNGEHDDMVDQLETLAITWNEALGRPKDSYYDWQTITSNLRLLYAFDNNTTGFNELTFNQAKRGFEDMIASIREDGLIIPARKYHGQKGGLRISIPCLPREYARLMFNESQTLKDKYHDNFDEFVTAMKEELRSVSMPAVEAVDNVAKRTAIKKMIDGVAYSYGDNTIALHLFDATYLGDVIDSIMKFGSTDIKNYADLVTFYEEKSRLQPDRVQMLEELSFSRNHEVEDVDYGWSGTLVSRYSTDKKIGEKIARGLVSLRSTLGVLYTEMPFANVGERAFNQGVMSIATHLGQAGILPIYNTDFKISAEARNKATHDPATVKFWSALREAQLAGVDRDFLAQVRSTQDVEEAIKRTFADASILEKINNKVLNVVSGKDIFIEGQIGLFLDRFCMYVTENSPLWAVEVSVDPNDPNKKISLMEQTLLSDPVAFFTQVFSGEVTAGEGVRSNDMDIAARCMNWALRGDMAQKNLVSAIYAELARRHAGISFFTSALVTPYFNYMTNRTGRLLQWVAPISSIHYLMTKFVTEGEGKDWKIPGTNVTFGQMMLEDVQLQKDMREAVLLDAMHLGPQLIALMLLGMGALEPPEDEDKWGNFKEWTFFGVRVDANWWIEDMLGLALPYAAFGASCREGKPRVDLIVNGLAYYLGNNPVTKVGDVVDALFDPLGEFYRDYENDVQGYARAMGSPPSMEEMVAGRATSFGLSFVSQFLTPGFLREIYNQGLDSERAYKQIFQENEYGRLTENGEQGEKVQYTTYSDAVVRKYTRNNPVMGLLADLLLNPNTGYMAHEMPKSVIYDPYQTNSLDHFSLYNDPYTKTDEKTDIEKDAIAIEVIGTLQANDIDELVRQGFALDYETKQYVSKYIWDILAEQQKIYNDFCASEFSDYYYYGSYEEGKAIVTEIKNAHFANKAEWNDLYYNKLWSDKLTLAKYNRVHTSWRQDANGDIYAAGYYPQNTIAGFLPNPITIAPGESPGEYQTNMGAEYDWQTESVVTGLPTGMRGLIPVTEGGGKTPSIDSWSTDGTDTGLSDRAANKTGNQPSGGSPSGNGTDNSGIPNATTGKGTRYPGGGGYSRRPGGGGGGGGGSAPNIYSRVNAPNISNPDTMRGARIYDANYDAIRPNFETKGSREAYKRSDI